MKLALVSDTHLPRFGRALPRALLAGFEAEGIDRIVHAGDWTDPVAVALLEAVAPLDGVAGNNDGPAIHERFGTHALLEPGGARIAVTHGHLGPGATTLDRARRAFASLEPPPDAIVFGHSHIPHLERLPSGQWLVNPGSPTDRRRQPLFTWAVMDLDGGQVTGVELRSYPDRTASSG